MRGPGHDDVAPASEFTWEDPWEDQAAAAGPPTPATPVERRPRRRRAHIRRRLALAGTLLLATAVSGAVVVQLSASRGKDSTGNGLGTSVTRTRTETAPRPRSDLLVPENATLRSGDQGDSVRRLQRALMALGFHPGPGSPDGVFGENTRTAVVSFQTAHGLAADGVVGADTARALNAAINGRAVRVGEAESELESVGAAPGTPAAVAEQGLRTARQTGRLGPAAARRYRGILARTVSALPRLPAGRRSTLDSVLQIVAAHASAYTEPRALALFSMLEANTRRLAAGPLPAKPADLEGTDGTVYRFFPRHGFQFHPLANFARLNAHFAQRRPDRASRLATALLARGVRDRQALTWEYYFPFGGPSRWTSGLAQGVAAQSLARTGQLVDDARIRDAARAAYLALPARLSRPLGGGLWVREYGYSDIAILNAQLQTLVSLLDYVKISGDVRAQGFTDRLATASRTLLDDFDSGCWSRYSLGGARASLHYHEYHIALLKQLSVKTGDPFWRNKALAWESCIPGR